jgi:hypothetical protein
MGMPSMLVGVFGLLIPFHVPGVRRACEGIAPFSDPSLPSDPCLTGSIEL